jgi:hypothetical protein
MPCDRVAVVSLDFAAANHDLLKKAAHELGLNVLQQGVLQTKSGSIIRLDGNQAVCNDSDQEIVQKLRVEYANQAVKAVAQKLGWRREVKGTNKIKIAKGY